MNDRLVLITGATGGIGKAAAISIWQSRDIQLLSTDAINRK